MEVPTAALPLVDGCNRDGDKYNENRWRLYNRPNTVETATIQSSYVELLCQLLLAEFENGYQSVLPLKIVSDFTGKRCRATAAAGAETFYYCGPLYPSAVAAVGALPSDWTTKATIDPTADVGWLQMIGNVEVVC